VKVVVVVTALGALSPMKFVPLLVPSFNFKVPPVAELPIKISSIALLLSTSNAELKLLMYLERDLIDL
jgi:hypothetical protein